MRSNTFKRIKNIPCAQGPPSLVGKHRSTRKFDGENPADLTKRQHSQRVLAQGVPGAGRLAAHSPQQRGREQMPLINMEIKGSNGGRSFIAVV